MGGNALKNVARINQENVAATIKDIERFLTRLIPGFDSKKYTTVIGSTGKKKPGGTSGDIDIVIDVKELSRKFKIGLDDLSLIGMELLKRVQKFHNAVYMKGFNIVSMEFPINNSDKKQPTLLVQVDFMLMNDLNFAKWMWFGPSEMESAYKGTYRNNLINIILRMLTSQPLSDSERTRKVLDRNKGLYVIRESMVSTKTGKPLKNPERLETKFATSNPDTIVKTMFGDKYSARHILTLEDTIKAIKQSPKTKSLSKRIFDEFEKDCEKQGIAKPECL